MYAQVNQVITIWQSVKMFTSFMSKIKFQHVSYRSAMIILWDALMYAHLHLLQEVGLISFTKSHSHGHHDIIIDIGYRLFYLLFPLFGLLADVKTGRYKTIIASMKINKITLVSTIKSHNYGGKQLPKYYKTCFDMNATSTDIGMVSH